MSKTKKRADFVSNAEGRTNRCIRNIRLLRDLSNTSKYDFHMDDLEKIKERIDEELEAMMLHFKSTLIDHRLAKSSYFKPDDKDFVL